jgi:geranylgeranyl diphosphate synthase type I
VPGPLDVDDLYARVGKALAGFLSAQAPVLDAVGDELGPMMDALSALTSSGKRLRPAFCYWGWRGAGGDESDAIVTAAASLELLQAGAIVHDDVMDNSDTRRGQPAVHRRFMTLHRSAGLRGDPADFGNGAAVLLGDLCLTWADQLLSGSGLSPQALTAARPVFDRMRTELMAGQYLDLLEQARGGGSVSRARRVIRFKSAKYTVEGPLHLGAALAGAGPDLLAAYSAYGLPLGEAFQLRDDVLGVFGDPECTGKPAGDDLREGKRTVLVALATERGTPRQQEALRRHLGDPHLDAAGIIELREVLVETGAVTTVEAMIDDALRRCRDGLLTARVTPRARQVLGELAIAATSRDG